MTTNSAVLKRGKGNPMLFFVLVTLLGLIVWAVSTVSFAPNIPKECEWTLCKKPPVIRLSNPSTGRIGYYCAEHGMQQMNKGWIPSP